MHEFEALLFSDLDAFVEICDDESKIKKIKDDTSDFSSPEEVNNSVKTAPSKRLEANFEGYKKTVDGINVAEKIGIEKMRKKCEHFNYWINTLYNL